MKVLIASDIHGRLYRMVELSSLIGKVKPDKIILLGDFLYNGPRNGVPDDYDPLAVSSLLNAYAKSAIGIKGNCDSRIDDDLLGFPLKNNRVLRINGYRCDLYHGDAYSIKGLKPHLGDILMSGHTHIWVLKKENGYFYLNPGSISFPKGGNGPTYALFEDKTLTVNSFPDGAVVASLQLP
jgi:putative phosphoesterase